MVSRTAFSASVADFLSPRRPESASIRSRLFIFTPAFPHGRPRLWHLAGPRPLTSPKLGDQAPLHNNLAEYCPRVEAFPSCFSGARQTCQEISGTLSVPPSGTILARWNIGLVELSRRNMGARTRDGPPRRQAAGGAVSVVPWLRA